MTKKPMLIVAAMSVLIVTHFTAIAQLDKVERLIFIAKSIKKIVVKQIDAPEPAAKETESVQKFEVTAYDKDGKEIEVTDDEADKLYKCVTKDSEGNIVEQKGIIEKLDEKVRDVNNKVRRVRNILRLVSDKGHTATKLEVHVADQYSGFSSAVGNTSISAGKQGLLKSAGQWISSHPYYTAAGSVAVVGGGIAAGGGGGGGGSSGGTSSGGGSTGGGVGSSSGGGVTTTTTTGGGDPSVYSGNFSGSWRGSDDGVPVSGSFSINISQNGAVSGSFSGSYSGSLSGSVSGSGVFSARGTGSEGTTWSGQITESNGSRSGNGTWSSPGGGGTWSGGG